VSIFFSVLSGMWAILKGSSLPEEVVKPPQGFVSNGWLPLSRMTSPA
jgi:hypothetical protein